MKLLKKLSGTIFSSRLFLLIFGILFIFLLGCKKLEFTSSWKNRAVTIDGENTEWQNKLTYIENKNVSVGLINDENFLYLCFITNDRQLQRQIMGMGFTLWFDSAGGKGKKFGIRFPLGLRESGMSVRGIQPETRQGISGESSGRFQELFENSLAELEILGPGKHDINRMAISELRAIDIHAGLFNGAFVYELKVPLVQDKDHPYGIGTKPGKKISIGFETPEIKRPGEMNKRIRISGGGMRGGGMRGRGMRGGGMKGGDMRSSRGIEIPEPLKMWATVQLASNPNSVSM